jgi:phosphoglycerol transferase MdoB-like AlkP superfamily enzyme
MAFDAFTKQIGFDEYLGMNEYNNNADYDGNWGIFDEPFMQYAANRMTQKENPFFSVIYTLSSHHPYTIPKHYENRFDKGTLASHETVGYTDMALQRFFETARTKDWFDNTLFIVTSDHSTFVENAYYSSSVGISEIPMFWYFSGHIEPKKQEKILSQIDLMPSLLHYIGYDKPFIAFGNSVFDSIPNYHMTYSGGEYTFTTESWVLNLVNDKPQSLKKDNNDFIQNPNVIDDYSEIPNQLETKAKSMIQQYNHRVIFDKFW